MERCYPSFQSTEHNHGRIPHLVKSAVLWVCVQLWLVLFCSWTRFWLLKEYSFVTEHKTQDRISKFIGDMSPVECDAFFEDQWTCRDYHGIRLCSVAAQVDSINLVISHEMWQKQQNKLLFCFRLLGFPRNLEKLVFVSLLAERFVNVRREDAGVFIQANQTNANKRRKNEQKPHTV